MDLVLTPADTKCKECEDKAECYHRTCCICLEDASVADGALAVTTCNHVLHETCLSEWLRQQTRCINAPTQESEITADRVRRCPFCRAEAKTFTSIDADAREISTVKVIDTEFGKIAPLHAEAPPRTAAWQSRGLPLPRIIFMQLPPMGIPEDTDEDEDEEEEEQVQARPPPAVAAVPASADVDGLDHIAMMRGYIQHVLLNSSRFMNQTRARRPFAPMQTSRFVIMHRR